MITTDYLKHKTLIEGHYYPFIYVKCVSLEDNNLYMILEDQYGIRHFVEHEHYKNFGITLNSEVNCLVAKINCTGRMYLEPEHPVYKIGEEYFFDIASSIKTEEGVFFSVYDCFGNLISIRTEAPLLEISQHQIFARVDSIKNGLPELSIEVKPIIC